MTNRPFTDLSDAVAPTREQHRELIDAACAWQDRASAAGRRDRASAAGRRDRASAAGRRDRADTAGGRAARPRRVDPDHFALICAAADAAWDPDVTPTRWTRTGTYHLVRAEIPNWCSRHRCLWPEEILDAVWEWFDFLDGTGRLDPASDPVAELRKPLTCYGWLDQHGGPLPEGAPRQVECECFLPYRETTELLGELVSRAERSGELPIDTLRRLFDDLRSGTGR